jgi:hypothetical protein
MPGDTDTPIKLPAGLVARIAEAAAAEATTPEAWIERVLTQQLDETRWQRLVQAGQRQSAALGYTEADVERLIAESRAEQWERGR